MDKDNKKDKNVETIENLQTLNNKLKTKNEELEVKAKEAEKVTTLQAELDAKEAKLYQITLDSRTNRMSNFLGTKTDTKDIIDYVAKLSDSEFEIYVDGKDNDTFVSKEEITKEKETIQSDKNEVDKAKEKIRIEKEEALKSDKEALVPRTEIASEDSANADEFDDSDAEQVVAHVKDLYKLKTKPIYNKRIKEGHEKKAVDYMNFAYDESNRV